jgi:hypothetical protein
MLLYIINILVIGTKVDLSFHELQGFDTQVPWVTLGTSSTFHDSIRFPDLQWKCLYTNFWLLWCQIQALCAGDIDDIVDSHDAGDAANENWNLNLLVLSSCYWCHWCEATNSIRADLEQELNGGLDTAESDPAADTVTFEGTGLNTAIFADIF